MAHHMPAQDHSHQTYSAADEKLFSKVGWRLLPLLIVSYLATAKLDDAGRNGVHAAD